MKRFYRGEINVQTVILTLTSVLAVLLFGAAAVYKLSLDDKAVLGGGGRQLVTAVNVLGTQADRFGMSTNTLPFPGQVFNSRGYDKVFFQGVYMPRANNAYARIVFECSIDDGSTYFFLPARSAGTAEVNVFVDSGTGQGTTSGIPFILPGDKTSVSGNPVSSTIAEFENNSCTHYRISVGETTTGASGTLWMQGGGRVGQ